MKNKKHPVFAVIGGTGIYQWPGLELEYEYAVQTPFGELSAPVLVGQLHGCRVAFLARHGKQHQHAPHRVNYRANIWALHQLGAAKIIAINAVGGITSVYAPGVLALPEQLIDYTQARVSSFCDVDLENQVTHIDFSEPYTESLRQQLRQAASIQDIPLVDAGVYAVTQGPRLETRAEIVRLASDGCDMVGMTAMPEAVLARELNLEYAGIAMVANWAAGCNTDGVGQILAPVSIDEIYQNVAQMNQKTEHIIMAFCQIV